MAERHRSQDGKRETDEFIEDAPETPGHGGRKQGNLERDVGTRDEEKRAEKGQDAGKTRVTKEDEEGEGNLGGHHGTDKGST